MASHENYVVLLGDTVEELVSMVQEYLETGMKPKEVVGGIVFDPEQQVYMQAVATIGLSRKQRRKNDKRERWLNAQEAIKLGLTPTEEFDDYDDDDYDDYDGGRFAVLDLD